VANFSLVSFDNKSSKKGLSGFQPELKLKFGICSGQLFPRKAFLILATSLIPIDLNNFGHLYFFLYSHP